MANQANLTREEYEDLEKRETYIQDQRNAIRRAVRLAVEQGIKENKVEIAQRLLEILDPETVSQMTGLSLEEIQRLTEL